MIQLLEELESGLFVLTGLIYFVAWVLYLVGWRQSQSRLIDWGMIILWIGVTVHLALIVLRYLRVDYLPLLTAYEFVSALVFVMVLAFLLLSIRQPNRILGVPLGPLAIGLMVYASLRSRDVIPEIPIFQSMMLKFHVMTALVAYSTWAIVACASAYYLFLSSAGGARMLLMDRIAYRAALIAFLAMTLCIVTGALWSNEVWGILWAWDPKETWSLITWLIFLAYLHARYVYAWSGTRAAVLALVGFLCVVFTYIGVDFLLPRMHGAGMTSF